MDLPGLSVPCESNSARFQADDSRKDQKKGARKDQRENYVG